MTPLNSVLLGTVGCVMDPLGVADPFDGLPGNDIDGVEFWARVDGTSASGIPITGERIVQRLRIMRNSIMAHATSATVPTNGFASAHRLCEFAVTFFGDGRGGEGKS